MGFKANNPGCCGCVRVLSGPATVTFTVHGCFPCTGTDVMPGATVDVWDSPTGGTLLATYTSDGSGQFVVHAPLTTDFYFDGYLLDRYGHFTSRSHFRFLGSGSASLSLETAPGYICFPSPVCAHWPVASTLTCGDSSVPGGDIATGYDAGVPGWHAQRVVGGVTTDYYLIIQPNVPSCATVIIQRGVVQALSGYSITCPGSGAAPPFVASAPVSGDTITWTE